MKPSSDGVGRGSAALRTSTVLDQALAFVSAEPASGCEWSRAGESLELRVRRSNVAARDRESIVGAGLALQSVRVLLRSEGALSTTVPMPDPGRPELVARIRIDGFAPVSADDQALRTALAGPSRAPAGAVLRVDPAGLLTRLRSAARHENAWLAVLGKPSAAAPAAERSAAERFAANDLVIGTTRDTPTAQLQAGQAARRVVLSAATTGLPVTRSPGEPVSESERLALRTHLGGGVWPQVVLRCAWPEGEPLGP